MSKSRRLYGVRIIAIIGAGHALLVALRDLQLTGESQIHRIAVDKTYFRVGFDRGSELGIFLYALRPEHTMHAFGERSLAMVRFYRADSWVELDPFIVAGVFGLTPAEAPVAVAMTEGQTIDALAARHSVSVNTIHSQLRSVFEKTGTTRQVELVGLLANLPSVALGSRDSWAGSFVRPGFSRFCFGMRYCVLLTPRPQGRICWRGAANIA